MSEHDEHIRPDDPLPRMIAEIDQLVSTAPHLARAAWGMYDGFRGQGFSESQSVYLVAAQITDSHLEAP